MADEYDIYVIKSKLDKTEKELTEAKRLLKLAVEDLHYLERHTMNEEGSCIISNMCYDCPFNNYLSADEKCIWNHEAEALALIGEDINVPASVTDTNVGGKKDGDTNG